MRPNHSFWRAIHSLAHPVSLLAIVLLLFNDHWLRYTYPSWFTGKLGDFTWLIFAPFIAAMCVAWLLPRRVQQHERVVGLLSIGFIGIWFATAKTIPQIHALTIQTLDSIVGWQGSLRMDITDLLTLPALLISGYIWAHAANTRINTRPVVYIAFGLGIMATLADSVAEVSSGIMDICEYQSGSIVAVENTTYRNADFPRFTLKSSQANPLQWERSDIPAIEPIRCGTPDRASDPNNPNIQYRWNQGENIQQSKDGGKTWTLVYDLFELRQDVRDRYNTYAYLPSPISGLVTQDGTLILAMSTDGTLIRNTNGQWSWVPAGEHYLEDLELRLETSLQPYVYIMLGLPALIFMTIIAFLNNEIRFFSYIFVLLWVVWLLLLPSVVDDRLMFGFLFSMGLPLMCFGPLGIAFALVGLKYHRWAMMPLVITSLMVMPAFIFPYILWAQGTIPRNETATWFSLLLTSMALLTALRMFAHRRPDQPKAKRKRSEKSKHSFFGGTET